MRKNQTPAALIGVFFIVILAAISAGCSRAGGVTSPIEESSPSAAATATFTLPAPTPTATPEPLALRIDGEGVPLAEFDAQVIQIQAADAELGITRTEEEQRQAALAELIDQTLLARAAAQAGFELSEAQVDARIAELKRQMGDEAAFNEWLSENGYSESSFRSALARSIRAAWQRDQILAGVPDPTEQVKARQVLVRSRETAEQILAQLTAGADFSAIAFQYDPLTGGDLGWFPRGFLTQPAVEEAAFQLQPGEVSDIIETDFGFHILQVVERDAQRPLSAEAKLVLQQNSLETWLESRRLAAVIEILLP
jgi:peptidyl-prolyl cis-trans isomerase C